MSEFKSLLFRRKHFNQLSSKLSPLTLTSILFPLSLFCSSSAGCTVLDRSSEAQPAVSGLSDVQPHLVKQRPTDRPTADTFPQNSRFTGWRLNRNHDALHQPAARFMTLQQHEVFLLEEELKININMT